MNDYENLESMWWHIQEQNNEIMDFIKKNEKNITTLKDNYDLLEILKYQNLKIFHIDCIVDEDIKVYIWLK